MNGSSRSAGTRRTLLDTAADLFAEYGVDAVNLRDIGRAAGQRNNSVVHYHFGDKDGLLRALLVEVGNDLDELYRAGSATDLDPIEGPLRRCVHSPRGRRLVALLTALVSTPSSRHLVLRSERLDDVIERLHGENTPTGSIDETRRAWFRGLFDVMAGQLLAEI